MNPFFAALIFYLSTISFGYSQTINFADLELKRYLVNEPCVDTTQNGRLFSNDLSVDRNGDREIQLSEALQVTALELNDY